MRIPLGDAPAPLRLRDRFDRVLAGNGLDIGAGQSPYPLPPGAVSRTVDQLTSEEHRHLFPEFPEDQPLPQPDIIANLDVDKLSAIGADTQDFVIASHVFEHLAEPIGMVAEVHRVLRPGGVFLLLLPDRRRTFDRFRAGTELSHLVAENEAGVTTVDDDHVIDFLHGAHLPGAGEPITAELIELHRRRSIHVHCWTEDEFLDVLCHCERELKLGFRLVEGFSARAGQAAIEFGFALEKAASPTLDPRHLIESWDRITQTQALDQSARSTAIARSLLAAVAPLEPAQQQALLTVADIAISRPDLTEVFGVGGLDIEAAVRWAAQVTTTYVDASSELLRPHAAALADWEQWLVPAGTASAAAKVRSTTGRVARRLAREVRSRTAGRSAPEVAR